MGREKFPDFLPRLACDPRHAGSAKPTLQRFVLGVAARRSVWYIGDTEVLIAQFFHRDDGPLVAARFR